MFLKGLRMLSVRLLARRVMPVKEENIIICFSHKKTKIPFFHIHSLDFINCCTYIISKFTFCFL